MKTPQYFLSSIALFCFSVIFSQETKNTSNNFINDFNSNTPGIVSVNFDVIPFTDSEFGFISTSKKFEKCELNGTNNFNHSVLGWKTKGSVAIDASVSAIDKQSFMFSYSKKHALLYGPVLKTKNKKEVTISFKYKFLYSNSNDKFKVYKRFLNSKGKPEVRLLKSFKLKKGQRNEEVYQAKLTITDSFENDVQFLIRSAIKSEWCKVFIDDVMITHCNQEEHNHTHNDVIESASKVARNIEKKVVTPGDKGMLKTIVLPNYFKNKKYQLKIIDKYKEVKLNIIASGKNVTMSLNGFDNGNYTIQAIHNTVAYEQKIKVD